MKRMICVCLLSTLLFVACKKKEKQVTMSGKISSETTKIVISLKGNNYLSVKETPAFNKYFW